MFVVSDFLSNKNFVAIVFSSLIDTFLNLLVNFVDRLGNLLILINSLVLFEFEDSLLQVLDILKEFFLLNFHILDHLLL